GWRRYFANPRLASFGAEEFDAYPKGTTGLLIPRALLVDAVGGFTSLFDVANLASDDTRLLRDVASRERIWIAPTFAFRYHGKAGARKFVRQAYFRGTTFVDSYLGQAGAVRRALIAALAGTPLAGALVVVLLVFAPLVALALAVAALLAVPAVVRLVGGSWAEARAAAVLTPVFVPVFGWGILRGLLLATTRAIRINARRA
ncbi:MAG TPA: hypothetical protein VFY84_06175, partial [Jiangellales bacterium]|nr:hypothetical protein [Jiangellales bacterium]